MAAEDAPELVMPQCAVGGGRGPWRPWDLGAGRRAPTAERAVLGPGPPAAWPATERQGVLSMAVHIHQAQKGATWSFLGTRVMADE